MAEASNPLAQFASRFLGEGQREQRTKRPTPLALDLSAVPFGQDEGLAATGSGPQGHAGFDHANSVILFSSQSRGRVLGHGHDAGSRSATTGFSVPLCFEVSLSR